MIQWAKTTLSIVFGEVREKPAVIRICKYEEKLLVARFGDDYKSYMRDVPMLFPRLFYRKG